MPPVLEIREDATGLLPAHVAVPGVTPGWLRDELPHRAVRRPDKIVCIGQKQVWFLLQFTGQETDLRLDLTDTPEFDEWRWVDFWYPMRHVVVFKRGVYTSALRHLAPFARQLAGAEAIPAPTLDGGRGVTGRRSAFRNERTAVPARPGRAQD